MTPERVDRAKKLRDALRDLPEIRKLTKRNYENFGLHFDAKGKEQNWVYSFKVDKLTGLMILDQAEKIIRRELKKLGVRIGAKRYG